MNNEISIIGVSRVRNVEFIIEDVLNHLQSIVDYVIVYDDASTDNTLNILKAHPLVKEIIENKQWVDNRIERAKAEGLHRQILYDTAKAYNPDWIYVFDADEFIEFTISKKEFDKRFDAYYFRLFDYYITSEDLNFNYKKRKYIGPEYRDIPMMFNANLDLKFNSRVPTGIKLLKKGGYVKHYGKAISVVEWKNKCNYYINYLKEAQPGNIDISDKWRYRLDKAIHSKSDFNNQLITWDVKNEFEIELTQELEKISTLKLTILVANNSLKHLGGSETYTFALLEELNKYPNFSVEYFTLEKGIVSDKIEKDLNVQFSSKNKYDLILANHNTCVNKLFNYGFIIQTCHGIYPKLEQPSSKADGYVSISQEVQNHLVDKGYSSKIIYNSINLNKFYPLNKINKSVKTILSLCHSEKANKLIKSICSEKNIRYIEAYKYNNPVWDIERIINEADLVFGLGRSAYEAMACGRPVVVFDDRNYFTSCGDGYLRNELGLSLLNNCSGRYYKKNFTRENLINEILQYNEEDQYYFRDFAKKELDVRKNIVKYLSYYLTLEEIKKNKNKKEKIIKSIKAINKKILTKLKQLVK